MASLLKELIDFLSPQSCYHCNNPLNSDGLFCKHCINLLNEVDKTKIESHYVKCFSDDQYIDFLFSLYTFQQNSPVQTLIHKLKYENKFKIGIYCGRRLSEKYKIEFASLKIDLLVPVPLHPVKKAERGYNQTFYIAKGISKVYPSKIGNNALRRIKFTETQTHLTKLERQQNVSGAFAALNKNAIHNKNILLIDDVITTGSTTNSCAKILKEAGANIVAAASIAIV